MRSTLILVLAAVAASVAALPGSSEYGSSEGSSYSGSTYGSSGESSYSSGDKSGSSKSSYSGNSSPSYGGDSYSKPSYSYESKSSSPQESKSYELKSQTKSESHDTKTWYKATKTHGSYSKETKASKTHSYLVGTHASKSHASYSKETHSYKAYSSKTEDCKTHTMTYTRTETAESGGYVSSLVSTVPTFFTDSISRLRSSISHSAPKPSAQEQPRLTPKRTPRFTLQFTPKSPHHWQKHRLSTPKQPLPRPARLHRRCSLSKTAQHLLHSLVQLQNPWVLKCTAWLPLAVLL